MKDDEDEESDEYETDDNESELAITERGYANQMRNSIIDKTNDSELQRKWKAAFRKHEHIPFNVQTVILDPEDKKQPKGKQLLESTDFTQKAQDRTKLKQTRYSTPYCLYIDRIVNILIPTDLVC